MKYDITGNLAIDLERYALIEERCEHTIRGKLAANMVPTYSVRCHVWRPEGEYNLMLDVYIRVAGREKAFQKRYSWRWLVEGDDRPVTAADYVAQLIMIELKDENIGGAV